MSRRYYCWVAVRMLVVWPAYFYFLIYRGVLR